MSGMPRVLVTQTPGGRPVVALFAVAMILGLAATRGLARAESLEVEEVSPGNFVHLGRHAGIEAADRDDIANIGFIVGEKCVAVIDTGGSVAVGTALKSAIRERTQLPICYVINTHVHFDHVLGDVAFKDEQPQFVGHAALPDAIAGNRSYFLENFGRELGEQASEADVIAPDMTVETTLTLDLGGRTLLLMAYPKAHTASDLTVFDESTGTLWTGDLLFRTRTPALDGSLTGWLAAIDAIEQEQGVKAIVPGHGAVSDDLHAAFADEKRYLQGLADEVRAYIEEGKPIDEAMEQVGASEREHWLLFEDVHKRNVVRAYKELEWE